MNDELRLQFSRDRLRGQLGFLSGRIVTDLAPIVVTHDPVVEIIVGNNVNSGGCHRSDSTRMRNDSRRNDDDAVTRINFEPTDKTEKI
jgi:hypothetical protein